MAILFSSTTGGETRKIKFCWNRSGVTVNLSIWMLNWINSQKEISNLRHTTNMHTTNNSRIGCLREFHRKKGKKSRDAVTFTHTSCHNIFGVYFFSIATVNRERGNKYVFLCNYYVQYTEKSSNCKERRNTSIFFVLLEIQRSVVHRNAHFTGHSTHSYIIFFNVSPIVRQLCLTVKEKPQILFNI